MLVRSLLFAALVGLTGWLCRSAPEIRGEGEAGVVMTLPERAGNFVGEKGEPDPLEVKLLPADTEFAKMVYHTNDADWKKRDQANVSIVLAGADRKSIHRPEVCLQGQGWTLLDSRVLPIDLGGGRTLRVRDLHIAKSVALHEGEERREIRAHYLYWFVGTNISTPDHVERLWITLRDNILHNVNHRWAYPSFMALVTENFSPQEIGQRRRNDAETLEMLTHLIHDLAPQFQKEFMPPAP